MMIQTLLLTLPLSTLAFQPVHHTTPLSSNAATTLKSIVNDNISSSSSSSSDEVASASTTSNRRSFMNKLVMGSLGGLVASSSSAFTDVANADEGNALVDVYFGVGKLCIL